MARIAGIDLPRDKRIEVALTYIYGIGQKTATKIVKETGVDPDIRVKDMNEDDVAKLREYIDHNLQRSAAIVVSVTAEDFLCVDREPRQTQEHVRVRLRPSQIRRSKGGCEQWLNLKRR